MALFAALRLAVSSIDGDLAGIRALFSRWYSFFLLSALCRLAERAAFSSQSDFLVAWGFSLKLFWRSLARSHLINFFFQTFFREIFLIYLRFSFALPKKFYSFSLCLAALCQKHTKKFRFILPRTHISATAVNRSTTLTQIRFQCSNYMARREVIITHRLCGYVCDYALREGGEKSRHIQIAFHWTWLSSLHAIFVECVWGAKPLKSSVALATPRDRRLQVFRTRYYRSKRTSLTIKLKTAKCVRAKKKEILRISALEWVILSLGSWIFYIFRASLLSSVRMRILSSLHVHSVRIRLISLTISHISVPQFIEPFLLQISRVKLKSHLWVQEISIRFDDFIITRGRRNIEFEIDLQIKASMNLSNDKFY